MNKNIIYKIWLKISHRVLKLIRNYTLCVLYYIVFPIISLAGSKMKTKKSPAESSWLTWGDSFDKGVITRQTTENWSIRYLSWSLKSGNIWAIFLYPFFLILKSAENSSDTPSPGFLMVYTLF
jgi:hypothetical protein